MKKKILFITTTFFTSIFTVTFGFLNISTRLTRLSHANTNDDYLYDFNFNKDKTIINSIELVTGQTSIYSSLNNEIRFNYIDASNNGNSAISFTKDTSCLYNFDQISGIRSININVSKPISLSYGYDEDNKYIYNETITKGQSEIRFPNGDPNYIKFFYLDYPSDIYSLTLNYSCSEGIDTSSIWNMKFNNDNPSTLYINQYISDNNDVIIPSLFNGYEVTKLGASSFTYNKEITNVYIPNTITFIGYSAFYKCSKLTSIYIPSSVIEMGKEAFARCTNLTIYLEAEEIPSSWPTDWNEGTKGVVLGAKRS